jgi:hypothetical protein
MAFGRNTSFAITAFAGALLASGCVSWGAPHDPGSTMTAAHRACMERATKDTASPAGPATDAPSGKCPMMDKKPTVSTDQKPEHEH